MTLHEIGQKHGTDKHDECHTIFGRSYLDIYEELFGHLKESNIVLVELGVKDGSSLRMWEEYFPNAQIIGIDIDPATKRNETDRIKIIISDQQNKDLPQLIGLRPNIIIDDASHVNDLTLASFYNLWPHLMNNGYYVMEDMACSYFDIKPFLNAWPGMSYNNPNSDIEYDNAKTRHKLDELFIDTIAEMNLMGPTPFPKSFSDTKSIKFYPMLAIIEKAC